MCMDRLADFPVPTDKNGESWAWGIFGITKEGKLKSMMAGNGKPYPYGKWIREVHYRDLEYNNTRKIGKFLYTNRDKKRYEIGFHKTLGEHSLWPIESNVRRRVKIREIIVTGLWMDIRVVVCKEMFIPEEYEEEIKAIAKKLYITPFGNFLRWLKKGFLR